TDVLLAGLQCQHITGLLVAALFDRLPDKSTGQEAHILAARRHEAERGPAVAHGVAEAHEFTYSDIGTVIGWGRQHAQRGRFGDIGNEDGFAFVRDWFNG